MACMDQYRVKPAMLCPRGGFSVGIYNLLDDVLGHFVNLVYPFAQAVLLIEFIDAVAGAVVDPVVVVEVHTGMVQFNAGIGTILMDGHRQVENACLGADVIHLYLVAPVYHAGGMHVGLSHGDVGGAALCLALEVINALYGQMIHVAQVF